MSQLTTITTPDKKAVSKARRILKELLGRQRLFGKEYSYGCVTLIDSGYSFVYRVRIADAYYFFEEYGYGAHLRHVFVKAEDITAPTPRDIGKAFLLDMLKGKGWRAVAQHRYGSNAVEIIKAIETLIEEIES